MKGADRRNRNGDVLEIIFVSVSEKLLPMHHAKKLGLSSALPLGANKLPRMHMMECHVLQQA